VDHAARPAENGLQNERTTLAWRRTNLSILAVSALAAKASGRPAVAFAVFGSSFGVCALVGLLADRRTRERSTAIEDWDAGRSTSASSAAAPLAVVGAAGLTIGLAVLGVLIAVF